MGYFLQTVVAECLLISFVQHIVNAFGQVGSIAEIRHIAILLVVYHLWDATHTESHTRYAAGHGFHDSIG